MTPLALFTDGSVHPPSGTGFAAYIISPANDPGTLPSVDDIRIKKFEQTTAARLELQALLWALEELGGQAQDATVYTDSQTIVGLLERRDRLESADYTAKSGRPLNNHDLYRAFFAAFDHHRFTIVKLEGHAKTSTHSMRQKIFARVDQAARKALRCSRGR